MKTITLKQAEKLLHSCSGVITSYTIVYPDVFGVEDDPENMWLQLKWTDDELYDYEAEFYEKDNQEIRFEGSCLFLKDSEGEEVEVSLLVPMKIEQEI